MPFHTMADPVESSLTSCVCPVGFGAFAEVRGERAAEVLRRGESALVGDFRNAQMVVAEQPLRLAHLDRSHVRPSLSLNTCSTPQHGGGSESLRFAPQSRYYPIVRVRQCSGARPKRALNMCERRFWPEKPHRAAISLMGRSVFSTSRLASASRFSSIA